MLIVKQFRLSLCKIAKILKAVSIFYHIIWLLKCTNVIIVVFHRLDFVVRCKRMHLFGANALKDR